MILTCFIVVGIPCTCRIPHRAPFDRASANCRRVRPPPQMVSTTRNNRTCRIVRCTFRVCFVYSVITNVHRPMRKIIIICCWAFVKRQIVNIFQNDSDYLKYQRFYYSLHVVKIKNEKNLSEIKLVTSNNVSKSVLMTIENHKKK